MTDESVKNFGKRKPTQTTYEEPPSRKRSGQIALLLMGTMAVGGGAYALMPHENCDPNQVISPGQTRQECAQRSSSSSGGGSGSHGYWGGSSSNNSSSSRTNFASSSASSSSSIAGTSSSTVARSGFGSFGSHFSGGG